MHQLQIGDPNQWMHPDDVSSCCTECYATDSVVDSHSEQIGQKDRAPLQLACLEPHCSRKLKNAVAAPDSVPYVARGSKESGNTGTAPEIAPAAVDYQKTQVPWSPAKCNGKC